MSNTYYLVGDIRHPGKVVVVADLPQEAIDKAENGEFEVFDESSKHLAFDWGGGIFDDEDNEVDMAT